MIQRSPAFLVALAISSTTAVLTLTEPAQAASPPVANRLTYLDGSDPFYPGRDFPKLTTPQWVGETGVEAVVILAIDDMRQAERYEAFLRPILERLKRIDGRAPVSIMCNTIDPAAPRLQTWLAEGLSLEVHTLTHPCPLLAQGDFAAAAETYHGSVALLHQVPGNRPVAFRMPCCDSMNSPSPRFYAELFNRTNALGQFLTIDSSVMHLFTSKDPSLPRGLVLDADGRERFRKYLPGETNAAIRVSMRSFVATIEDYPYPYVIGKLCWEFPCMAPSDWEAQNLHGVNHPATVADWQAALDLTVLRQGVLTMVFHPHGWIRNDQLVALIDYAVERYGPKVKFLTFREAQNRLDRHLLDGQPLRAAAGQDNGARLLDVNHDGFLDVILAGGSARRTRLWQPARRTWLETSFPTSLITQKPDGQRGDAGVRFGVIDPSGQAIALVRNRHFAGAWVFTGDHWTEEPALLNGLILDGQPVFTALDGVDRGVRLRDVDADGRCELLVANESQSAVFTWSAEEKRWKPLPYALPPGVAFVDAAGRDHGLRFVDVNEDGYDDVLFSNEERYSAHLFVPRWVLGFQAGWTRELLAGRRGDPGELPPIVRGGEHLNNGAWFHSRHLWVQNEDTADLPDKVDRRSFEQIMGGWQPPALSPEESLSRLRARTGFQVELVAAEPLVRDPIAFEWGADGKLWVVEMGDYPTGLDGRGRPGGKVCFLEDRDQDGRYEQATVFLDELNFPTGVLPWRNGVLVSAAPEIFYAEDTDGDGRADRRQILFTGFREGNPQHRVNGFEYGLDHWVYGANGDSGGQVRWSGIVEEWKNRRWTARPAVAPSHAASADAVDLRGRDFRFRPDTGEFEAIEGQTQFGRRRDDWGHWFGNNNPSWGWHYWLPERYLARNPTLAVPATRQPFANYPDATRVYPLSRLLQRFNDIGMAYHVTSGCSVAPYRDDLFGPEFATSVFISEPVHNLVHREVLEPDGVSFTSRRAPDEQTTEFLASSDNWFRPITLKTGPDGALYVADMYRLVLEHPEWIPPDAVQRFDLRAGADQGRLYRVYPTGATLRPPPRLDRLSTRDLVRALDSPNGWQRDTAQRLLVERGDRAAVKPLQRLSLVAARPKTRLQALCTLDGLGAITPDWLPKVLADAHPAVRRHAIRLSEPFLVSRTPLPPPVRERWQQALLELARDADPGVRFQLALSLGGCTWPGTGRALAELAVQSEGDDKMLTAILTAAGPHLAELLPAVLQAAGSRPWLTSLSERLVNLAVAQRDEAALAKALPLIATPGAGEFQAWQFAALAGWLDALERQHTTWTEFGRAAGPDLKAALSSMDALFAHARAIVLRPEINPDTALAAIRLLGRGPTQTRQDLARLAELLRPQWPAPVQQAALRQLARRDEALVAELLVGDWSRFGPDLRSDILAVLLRRPSWTQTLLRALESGQVTPGQVHTTFRQKLLEHRDAGIREQARRLFAQVSSDRRQVVEQYAAAERLPANATRGAELFRQNCAACHRLRGEGYEVGPDLAMTANKSFAALLTATLNPNDAVEARYLSYTATLKDGQELSGVIVATTPNNVTLRNQGGVEHTVLRSELQDLASSGLSLMPDGFENALSPQDLADLIAYLQAN